MFDERYYPDENDYLASLPLNKKCSKCKKHYGVIFDESRVSQPEEQNDYLIVLPIQTETEDAQVTYYSCPYCENPVITYYALYDEKENLLPTGYNWFYYSELNY